MNVGQVLGGCQNWRSRDRISADNNFCPMQFNMPPTNMTNFSFDPIQYSGVWWITEKVLLPPKVFVKLLSDPVRYRSYEAQLLKKIKKGVEVMLSCQ